MRPLFFFEIYLKGPEGETGYDIKVGTVRNAKDKKAAEGKLRSRFGAKFDCVIQLNEVSGYSGGPDAIHLDAAV